MTQLWLAPGVFARTSNDGAVLLDVGRDVYLGLDAQQARALAGHVADWPRSSAAACGGQVASWELIPSRPAIEGFLAPAAHSPQPDAGTLVSSLVSRGLLRERCTSDRILQSASLPPVRASLHAWPDMNPRDVRIRDVLTFVRSLTWARRLTRRGRLREAIERTRERRQRCARGPVDLAKACIALGRYIHIRAFFFAKRGRCLLDTLALIEFLAHEGLYPHWVIGVQVRPFAAHSWVQEGPFVFNGTPEYAGAYLPILTV